MKNVTVPSTALAAASLAVSAPALSAADDQSTIEIATKIKDKNDQVRTAAWQRAAQFGPPAVRPLASLIDDPEVETTRAAKRALWQIVRRAGRPKAEAEAKAVVTELLALLSGASSAVRRETLWMLSEIGGDEADMHYAEPPLWQRDLAKPTGAATGSA